MVAIPARKQLSGESIQDKRFKTYLNYVETLSNFLSVTKSFEGLKNTSDHKSFSSIQGGKCCDYQHLERVLRNAWFTELQLNLPSQFDDFAKFSNHWAVVQSYYACFLSVSSVFLSKGQNVEKSHAAASKEFSNLLMTSPKLYQSPYNILCVHQDREHEYINAPKNFGEESISTLSNLTTNNLEHYATFLKTTRDKQIKKRCDQWKNQNKKNRISSIEKKRITITNPPTSFLNCFYRLRCLSNYEDADYFLFSLNNEIDANLFNKGLCKIVWHFQLNNELLIAKNIGKNKYISTLENFSEKINHDLTEELMVKRWGYISKVL